MDDLNQQLGDVLERAWPSTAMFSEVTYRPGSAFGPRVQADVQFVMIHRGGMTILVNDKPRTLMPDEVCCLHPGGRESFACTDDGPTHHSWVAMHFDPVAAPLRALLDRLPFKVSMTRRLTDVRDLGLAVSRRRAEGDAHLQRHLGAAFFHAFAAACRAGERDRPVPEPVVRARRYIERHFARAVQLHDIARAAGVTANHIVRLFSRHLDHTPIRYLWHVRVQRGADLLRDTGLSVSEIAYRVGFSTPYHFSRRVKQQLGLCPRQLRQRYWNPPR
jgi:AraC family transcriptional regulator of arabinose operon